MNYNILLVYFILSIIVVVKGETQKLTTESYTSAIPVKTLPTKTFVSSTRSVKVVPTGIDSLPISKTAKKYCRGHKYTEIKYNDEHFICYVYDRIEHGCVYMTINEEIITSIPNDCHNGKQIEEGVYEGSDVYFNNKCTDIVENMVEREIIDYSIPAPKRRDLSNSNPEYVYVSSIEKVPLGDSLKELAKKYCMGGDSTEIRFNSTDFVCYKSKKEMLDPYGCLGPSIDIESAYLTFNNDCVKGQKFSDDIYSLPSSYSVAQCDSNNMKDWSYYIIESSKMLKTLPITTTFQTKTLPVKTIPTTTTKTVPTTTTTTATTVQTVQTTVKTVPIEIHPTVPTTTVKTVPTTTVKTVPTTTTTTAITVQTVQTTVKTVPVKILPTTTTKTIPIPTTITRKVISTLRRIPIRTFRQW